MSKIHSPLPMPTMGPAEIANVRAEQRLLDAQIELAQAQAAKLARARKDLEQKLWMEIDKEQLIALLADGSYGKSLSVRNYWGVYTYDSSANLNQAGELIIGGFHHHDHFRGPTVWVRKDFERY